MGQKSKVEKLVMICLTNNDGVQCDLSREGTYVFFRNTRVIQGVVEKGLCVTYVFFRHTRVIEGVVEE